MLKISFQNSGGELDSRTGLDPAEALAALKEMLEAMSSLEAGDKIVITETDED